MNTFNNFPPISLPELKEEPFFHSPREVWSGDGDAAIGPEVVQEGLNCGMKPYWHEKIHHIQRQIDGLKQKSNHSTQQLLKNKDKEIRLLQKKNRQLAIDLKVLSTSKLGKLQVKYWALKKISLKSLDPLSQEIQPLQDQPPLAPPDTAIASYMWPGTPPANHNRYTVPQRIPCSRDAILFMATNGTGLGHLTRSLAIAKRIREGNPLQETVFLTTSTAMHIIIKEGFPAYYLPPKALLPETDTTQWGTLLTNTLQNLFSLYQFSTVIFDGAYAYAPFLKSITGENNLRKIWVKRGCEKEALIQRRTEQEKYFDYIIIPGETGEPLKENNANYFYIPPVLFLNGEDLLTRAQARRFFKAPEDKLLVYVQLGCGNINDITSPLSAIIRYLKEKENVVTILAESVIGKDLGVFEEDVILLKDYPNAKYFNGFDLAISACGYNTIQEIAYFGLPAILIPNEKMETDDQYKRAKLLESRHPVTIVTEVTRENIAAAFDTLLEKIKKNPTRNPENNELKNGAGEAARIILDLQKETTTSP